MGMVPFRQALAVSIAICGCLPCAVWAQEGEGPTDWRKLDDAAMVRWVAGGGEWKSFDSYQQVQMAARLKKIGEPAGPALDAIIRHVSSLDRSQAQKLGPERWRQFATVLKDNLDEATRAAWIGRIRAAHVVDGAKLASLELDDIQRLTPALAALGDPDAAGLSAAWINGSENWKKLDTGALQWVTGRLKGDEASMSAKGRVVEHIESKYLSDKATANKIGPAGLCHVTLHVADAMSPAVKARWAKKLDDYFFDSPSKGWQLTSMLKKLDAADRARLLTVRVVGETEGWKQQKPESLKWLLISLQNAGREGQEAMPRVAGHVTATYARDAASAKTVSMELWAEYAKYLAKFLSDEQKTKWASAVRSAYGTESDAETVSRLTAVMGMLGAEASADRFRLQWVSESDEWKQWSAEKLAPLAGQLAEAGDAAKGQRAVVAAHVEAKFLADLAAAREAPLYPLNQLIGRLAGDLSDADRARWAGHVRKAYVADKAALAGLKAGDMHLLSGVLKKLDDDAADVQVAWVAASDGWASLGGYELYQLSQQLKGEAGTPARRKMAAVLTGNYLADAETTRKVSPEDWKRLAGALEAELGDEQRATWRAKVWAAYGQDPAGLGKLSYRDVGQLAAAMKVLGDPQPQRAFSVWVEGTETWHKLNAIGLQEVASRLGGMGEEGKAARGRFLAFVTQQHLADAASTRKIGMQGWEAIVAPLAGHMPDATRAQWAKQLEAAYATSAADRGKLRSTLARLGHAELAKDIEIELVTDGEKWKEYEPTRLASLASVLAGRGADGRGARLQLLAHVTEKHLPSAGSVEIATWGKLINALGGDMTPPQRRMWSDRMIAAFAQRADAESLGHLAAILGMLDRPEDAAVCRARWVAATDVWKTYSAAELATLAMTVSKPGASAAPAAALIAEHVKKIFLTDAATVRTVSLHRWSQLAGSLRGDLTPADRQLWVTRLREAYASDARGLGAMKRGEFDRLVATLKGLGDQGTEKLEATWVANTTHWQSLTAYEQGNLAGKLKQMGQAGDAGREKMRRTIEQQYLADPASTRQLSTEEWRRFAGALMADRPVGEKQAWAQKIRAAHTGSPAALDGMRDRDVVILVDLLTKLGDTTAPAIWVAYFEQGDAWKQTDTTTLSSRAGTLASMGASAKPARARLIEHLTVTYLADKAAARKVGMATWHVFVAQLAADMNEQTRALWAVKLQDAFADYKPPNDSMVQAKLLWALKKLQNPG